MSGRALPLPGHVTPEEFAEHFGLPPRSVREKARKIGACKEFGKTMFLLEEHVTQLLEAMTPCPSKSSSAEKSGTIEAPLMGSDFADLQKRLTAKSQKGSKRKSSAAPGNVISMGRRPG